MSSQNPIPHVEAFALDPRGIEETLRDIKDYTALIPFDETAQGDGDNNWGRIFFPGGDTDITHLAERYRAPDLSDGELPPHQAFLLAFLRQLETAKTLLNSLPARHRQLYYRDLLGLAPRGAQADQVVASFNLMPGANEQLLLAGVALNGGQDSLGQALRYLLDAPLQINSGRLSDVYWTRPSKNGTWCHVVQSGEEPPFPTDGVRLFSPQPQDYPAANGRVIAADILALSSGQRTLSITFASAPNCTLQAAVSTKQGWLALPPVTVSSSATTVAFTVAADQPALSPPQGLDGFIDTTPLLKLSRNDGLTVPVVNQIEVTVTLPADVAFRTQDGVAQPDQPCLPFGAEVPQGSAVRLMTPDWCRKSQAIQVTLTPEWQGLPEGQSFAQWYAGYTNAPVNDDTFKVTAAALSANGWKTLDAGQPLFASNANAATAPAGRPLTFTFTQLLCDVVDSADPDDWASRLRLTLEPTTFLHQQYWQLVNAGATGLTPPYTPQWAGLDIAYTSTQLIEVNAQYRLTPFGHQAAGAEEDEPAQPQLYLGLSDILPGQQLSLYWKLCSPQALDVDWQYLNQNNQWIALNADVLDGTDGLFASGLWSATLPNDAGDQSAHMPAGRYWLRGVMTPTQPQKSDLGATTSDYPQLQGLLANAMTATLADPDTMAADHFAQPLLAGRVSKTMNAVLGLAGVTQPWPSQHGRPLEALDDFNRRIAQRLSHRGRALRQHDLQMLLRDLFPEVGSVILPEGPGTPGKQLLTVIPAPDWRDNDDPKRPAFNPARLDRMRQAMQRLTSPWAEIDILNPVYIGVLVTYAVTFVEGISPAFGNRQVDEALVRQYIPWTGNKNRTVISDNILDYYEILSFIQRQPLVETVHTLFLNGKTESITAARGVVLILEPGHETVKIQLANPARF